MLYFVKTPWWLKRLYPRCVWDIPASEKIAYLTFDDGPNATATPYVLDVLKKYNAKATFFCIGKNVVEQHEIYRRILDEGHRVGNHTFDHFNGWKVRDEQYLQNILQAGKYIDSNLFRPPYGKITRFQVKLLMGIKNSPATANFRIVMWDVLSGDFDINLSYEKCASNVIKNVRPGSVIVFHDSDKAFPRMKEALPRVLEHLHAKGYRCEVINM
jgi:peptidoglycan/xylan/chitin deacetylase (PgdA/CDA1 family)